MDLSHFRWLGLVIGLGLAAAVPSRAAQAGELKGGAILSGSVERRGLVAVAGTEGAVVALNGGPRLTLAPATEIQELPPTFIRPAGGRMRTALVVTLRSGSVDVDSTGSPATAPAVLVNGPRSLGGILLDGHMSVHATPDRTMVQNHRGSVLAGGSSRWDTLAEGRLRELTGRQPKSVERELPAAPTFAEAGALWVTADPEAAVAGIRWSDSVAAAHYQLTIRRAGEAAPFQAVDCAEASLTTPVRLPAGSYLLAVAAVDAGGLVGLPSPELGLEVIRVRLPPGAYFESAQRIRLTHGQSLELEGAAGLQMTYGQSETWVDASSRLTLHRDEPMRVRLRPKGGGPTTSLELAPRGVSATITVGPRRATWPSTPATIEVRLVSAGGGPVPTSIKAKPRVLVGLEAVPTTWHTEGGRLWATVKPQAGTGPWLLRVEVRDQYGLLLGEEFFEVAPDPKRHHRRAW